MVVTRCSPILHISKIASALPFAPPLRLPSSLSLCFRRHHANQSHQFSPFEESEIHQRTQHQRSAPNRRKPALSVAEVKADVAETEWTLSRDLCAIERRYVFRNFDDAFKYLALVVQRCKAGLRHFPMSSNWGNRLFIRWASYHNSCVTRTDLQLSRFCDRLYDEQFAENVSKPEGSLEQIPDDLAWADDRQIVYGPDTFYWAENALELWQWLPQVQLYAQKHHAYPLWGISHNRLVWTRLLWDSQTGLPSAMTLEDRSKWRPGTPIRRAQGTKYYWLSNLADRASQIWLPDTWVEKPENPNRLPLRLRLARNHESFEKKREREKEKENEEKMRPKRPRRQIKNVRIYVD